MDAIAIHRAEAADAPLLVTLIAGAFADVAERFGLTRDNCPAHTSFITADDIRTGLGFGSLYYIASVGGTPCGCVAVRRPKNGRCTIEKLAVLPAFRRHGVGRALLQEALADAKRSGGAFAEIGIIAAHGELRSWYEKLGFKARRQIHYDHLPFDVLHLERSL